MGRSKHTLRKVTTAAAVIAAGCWFLVAASQPPPPVPPVPPGAQTVASGALDGMVFEGRLGPLGAPDRPDELHFQDGRFWSSSCVRCGFSPGAYFVRHVGDAVHFRGEIAGHGGRFHYEGIVAGGRVRADVRWIKKRWYWTIDREFEFVGATRPADRAAPASEAVAAARAAIAAGQVCEP